MTEMIVDNILDDYLKISDRNFEKFIEEKKISFPQKNEIFEKMLKFHKEKLYHELSELGIVYIRSKDLSVNEKIETFFQIFDSHKNYFNPILFTQILAYISFLIDSNEAEKLFDFYKNYTKENSEAHLLFLSVHGENMCRCKMYKESELLLEEVKEKIESGAEVDFLVFRAFHKSCAELYKGTKRLKEFYTHANLYLSYTPLEYLSVTEKENLAYDLSIAAILSKEIFEFAELLEAPIIKENLKEGKNEWLFNLLMAFCNGSIKTFLSVCDKNNAVISNSELGPHEKTMLEKITLLALMELAFNRPKKLRKFSFTEIAEHCQIPFDEVENIIMLSMSNNLIKGKIDEIDQVLNISYIKPRILDNQRLEVMRQRINMWADSAEELLFHLESITPELLVS